MTLKYEGRGLFCSSHFSLRSRRLELVSERENGRARGVTHSCPPVFSCAHYYQALKSLERAGISEHAFLHFLSERQRNDLLGSFGWTSVTYDWLMVALDTIDQ